MYVCHGITQCNGYHVIYDKCNNTDMRENTDYGRGPECSGEHEVRADTYRHRHQ